MSSSSSSGASLSFPSILTLIFIVLKLTGNISWSWFWVLSPSIFSVAFVVLMLIIMGIIAIVAS